MKKTSLTIGAGVLLAAIASLGFLWPFSSSNGQLSFPGTVEVQEIRLGSKLGGRVGAVFVHEGEIIDEGKELIRFETPELEAQRDQVKQRLVAAEAELKKAEEGPRPQERTEAEAALDAAKARLAKVNKGWRDEEVRQAKHDLIAAEADLELTSKSYERMQKLFPQVSQHEYDLASAQHKGATSRANSARARFDMLSVGSRKEDIAEIEAEHRRARARLELIQAGTREEDKTVARAMVAEMTARLKELQAHIDEATVRSPSRIQVEVLGVRKGDLVAPNQPVIRALHADDRWVKIFVPSPDLGRIHVQDSVEVTCDTYPNRPFSGRVIQIASFGEFTPRNVQSPDERKHQVFAVKVSVEDPDGVLKSGMAAQVKVTGKGSP